MAALLRLFNVHFTHNSQKSLQSNFLLNCLPGPPEPSVAVEEACERDRGEGGAGQDDDHDEEGRRRARSRTVRQHKADLGRGRVEEGSPIWGNRSMIH